MLGYHATLSDCFQVPDLVSTAGIIAMVVLVLLQIMNS